MSLIMLSRNKPNYLTLIIMLFALFTAVSLLLFFKDGPEITIYDNSVRSFVYHALHKTGSAFTRGELRRFCHENGLVCLTYCICSEEYCWWHIPDRQIYKICDCTRKVSQFSRDEINLVCGSFSPNRLTNGCCPNYEKFKNNMTGVIDHFSLETKENRDFIDHNFKGAFRFTLIREPMLQFISYVIMDSEDAPGLFPDIHTFVDICYNFTMGLTVEQRFVHLCSYHINTQSRELGWNRNPEDHKLVLDYVEKLDFVGLTQCLHDSWRLLRQKLNWPEQYFVPREKKPRSRSILDEFSDERKMKLRKIQSADIDLYDFTRKLFLRRYGACNS